MPSGKDLLQEPLLKCLVWSPQGTGKTTLIGTATALGPTYIFDFDQRIQGLAGLDFEYDTYFDTNPAQPRAFDAARAKLDNEFGQYIGMPPSKCPWKVIALDGLTTFQIAALNKSMPNVKAFMTRLSRITDGKISVPVMQDYQASMAYTEQFILKLVRLPCHIIVTGHVDTTTDEVTGAVSKSLAISGKLANRLPGFFNEIYRMQVTNKANSQGQLQSMFQVVTRPDNLYYARTCYPDALLPLEQPDFAAMVRKVEKYLDSKKGK